MLTARCNNPNEFLPLIDAYYKKVHYSPSCEIILFRGQNVDKPLIPKYARTVELMLREDLIKSHEILSVERERFLELKRRAGWLGVILIWFWPREQTTSRSRLRHLVVLTGRFGSVLKPAEN